MILKKKDDIALEALTEFLNAAEAGIVSARRIISEEKGVIAVNEATFNLNYQKQIGIRIGEYEVANKIENDLEKFQRALNILNKNNATIANRYKSDGYAFSYWVYQEKIYRQLLKTR